MKNYDHKRWLEFLQRAAELPLHYSVEELQGFKETADTLYPSISPLVLACITLAKGDTKALPALQSAKERDPPTQVAKKASLSSMYADLLLDVEKFPRNSDLLKFAQAHAIDLPRLRFDKMSKQRIANTIAQRIVQSPKSAIRLINEDLGIGHNADSASEFFTTWERTIKNG